MIYFVCCFDSVDCIHYVALKKKHTHTHKNNNVQAILFCFILFYSVSFYYCIIFQYIINVETVSLYII